MMTRTEQLDKWVEGESIHRGTTREEEECCPDFSCCCPECLAPKKERELFREAYLKENNDLQEQMLMMFLGSAISKKTDKKVYIAGDAETHEA